MAVFTLRKTFDWFLSAGLAAVFIQAGWTKASAPEAFAQAIANYHLVPEWVVPWMAGLLPGWEIMAGLAIFFPRWRRGAALILGGLSAVFLAAVTLAMLRKLEIPCGCFGAGSGPVGWKTWLLDLACLGASAWILRPAGWFSRFFSKHPGKPDHAR